MPNIRATVSIEVEGSSAAEVLASLTDKWRKFIDDKNAELPNDAEISVTCLGKSETYVAIMHARMRIGAAQ